MQSDQIRASITEGFVKSLRWRKERKEKSSAQVANLPPFLAAKAVYNDRLRISKVFCVGVVLLCGSIVTLQELRFRGALESALTKEFLIVPGVVDFMRVRPGIVPENVVFYFAEFIAEQIGTFSFQTVEDKYARVSEFMTPQLRETFLAEMRKNMKLYKEVSVTEIFNPRPATKFKQMKDEGGNPYYLINIEGTLERFSNDQRIEARNEVISLSFRTTRILPDKPWFFELTSIKRQEPEEFAKEQDAKSRLAQGEDSRK
jgi:hypothetical protein